ncbi:ArsR family transcriptional regulator [Ktedonobacter sp. SOSP1-52]|uniref:arsenate reductase/protein-tyrosine-phosphatase family protein n=1 Tax=Ktedonobacter sp. SOSP1-52 TaxID=2778366 RepID=UPI001915DC19|nr:ArsR family transcriptional regulator [Ktedonobacter sp. SOSP1-52]GHO64630.1 ArsR family transcriptional regulator [Ktedonobacter sp. SOSP1-52]
MENALAPPPSLLKLVAHEVRWNLLRCLARSDYRVQDLVDRLQLPQNLISYHLKLLRQGQLVRERHSSADEREVFYRLEVEQLQQLYWQAGDMLHPAITLSPEQALTKKKQRPHQPLRILFLCTENSARSQMAEALLRHLSHGMVEAFSVGSTPAEQIHPQARQCMERMGIDMSLAVPKHLDLFQSERFDAIITVCDSLHEVCPTFPGDPERIHWSVPDPARTQGTEEQVRAAFEQTALQLTTRLRFLLPLLEREKGLVLP